ncbi:MAG: Gfo/Idh/MocA family oxidoreductase [Burkholderiales bacterium]|nr:Gfo/Idh/MocA family oxidoreductase [Burkholderiales bacterium]
MPLSAAILGVTHWHAPRYVKHLGARGVRVIGASDADAQAGRAAADRLGLAFAPDTDRALATFRPDLAVLLPRHDLAAREIGAVAVRGVPMLVEKPMGRNGDEAAAAAAAVRAAGVFAAVCLPNRHLGIWDAYRALVAEDALGEVLHAHFRTINGPPSRYLDYGVPWMLDPAIGGGGALRNLGIHGADAICMLAGAGEPAVAGARLSHARSRGAVEDFAAAVVSTPAGFVATLEAGYTYANLQEGGDYEWRIAATGAYLHECNGRLTVHRRGGRPVETAVPTPHLAYAHMVDAALDAFAAGHAPPATVDDCVRAVRLQDRIYAAARAA